MAEGRNVSDDFSLFHSRFPRSSRDTPRETGGVIKCCLGVVLCC